jgi:hypothetical protein
MKKRKIVKRKNPFVFNEEVLKKWCYENFKNAISEPPLWGYNYTKKQKYKTVDINTLMMWFVNYAQITKPFGKSYNTYREEIINKIEPYFRKYATIWENIYNSNIPKTVQDQMWRDIMLKSVMD